MHTRNKSFFDSKVFFKNSSRHFFVIKDNSIYGRILLRILNSIISSMSRARKIVWNVEHLKWLMPMQCPLNIRHIPLSLLKYGMTLRGHAKLSQITWVICHYFSLYFCFLFLAVSSDFIWFTELHSFTLHDIKLNDREITFYLWYFHL